MCVQGKGLTADGGRPGLQRTGEGGEGWPRIAGDCMRPEGGERLRTARVMSHDYY